MIVSVVSEGCIVMLAFGTMREMMNRRIHNIINISKRKTKMNRYFFVSYVCKWNFLILKKNKYKVFSAFWIFFSLIRFVFNQTEFR